MAEPTPGRGRLKPRAIVVDLFGEHIRHAGGEARMQALTDLLDVFGVGGSSARIALARMRTDGWFRTQRDGRATRYCLTDAGRRLLDADRARVLQRRRDPWDGQWRMVIYRVSLSDRPERERLRHTLTDLGFGALAPATWVTPHPRLDDVLTALGETSATRLEVLTCRSRDRAADREMAARCWDLDSLAREAAAILDRLEALPSAPGLAALPGPEALRLRMELLAEHRDFSFRDPDLPAELLPDDWPGRRTHTLFLQAHNALAAPADAFVRAVMARHSRSDGD